MIENMFEDCDYEFGPLPIVAAFFGFGKNPYAGKNSWFNRSARAKVQRRDPGGEDGGEFIEQGGMGGINVRFADGKVRRVLGEYVGETGTDSKTSKPIFYVTNDPSGFADGFYAVNDDNFDIYDGPILPALPEGTKIPEVTGPEARKAQDADKLQRLDAPPGWIKNDDGSFTTDDGEYTISAPSAENNNQWELSRKDTKYSDHQKLSDAIKRVSQLDTREGLSQEDADKVQDLLNEEVQLEQDIEGEGPEADAARTSLVEVNDAINKILGNVSKPKQDGEQQQAKKTATLKLSDDRRRPSDATRQNIWNTHLNSSTQKAIKAVNEFNKKRAGNSATAKDISDTLAAIDKAFDSNYRQLDADVDALKDLMEEYVQLPQTYAYLKNKADKLPDGDEKTALVSQLQQFKTRDAELRTQIAGLQTAISTRAQNNDQYADQPTVDTSTTVPDITEFEAPVYGAKRGKGRPKGTGKNQIAAKKAAEEQQKPAEAPATPEPTPVAETPAAPEGPTPEERKAEAEAKKAEAEARKAEAEAKQAEDAAKSAETPAPVAATKKKDVLVRPTRKWLEDGAKNGDTAWIAQPGKKPKEIVHQDGYWYDSNNPEVGIADGTELANGIDAGTLAVYKGDLPLKDGSKFARIDSNAEVQALRREQSNINAERRAARDAAKAEAEAKKAEAPTATPEVTATPEAKSDTGRRTSVDGWSGEQTLADWQDAVDRHRVEGDSLSDQAMATAEMQGMDGAPQALSDAEFDAFDGEPLFRGFNSEDSKQKFYADENWVGSGGNGSGIYTSTSKSHAGRYGNFDDSRIVDLKLRPDAVIMDLADLEARRQVDFDKAMAEDNLLGAQLASGDLGVYATAIGVDGYRADIEGFPSVVLTNREAVVARKSDATPTPSTDATKPEVVAEVPAPEATKAAEPAPAPEKAADPGFPDGMSRADYLTLLENPFHTDEEKAAAIVARYDNEAGELKALFDSGADGATLQAKLREIAPFVSETDDVRALRDKYMKAGMFAESRKLDARVSQVTREEATIGRLTANTPEERAALAAAPSKEKDATGKAINDIVYPVELDGLPTGTKLEIAPTRRADGSVISGLVTKQEDGTWTLDSDGSTVSDIRQIANSGNKLAYKGSPAPTEEPQTDVTTPEAPATPEAPSTPETPSAETPAGETDVVVEEPTPAAPEVTSPEATATELDVNGDLKSQIEQAIENGQKVSFWYQGSGDAPTKRTVTPESVWTNPKSGQDNMYGLQEGADKKQNFTLSKMENAPDGDQTTPANVTPAATAVPEPTPADPVSDAESVDTPTPEQVDAADAVEPTAAEEAVASDADLSLITTKTTDEDYAGEAYLPTEEQRNVIDAVVSELDVSVQALAGSGKTSTLVLAATQMLNYHPDKKILYIAFNKTVQLEAEERMPEENTEARTGDSLAWWGVSKPMRDKIGKGHALPKDIADDLGIPTSDKNREDIAIDTMRVIEKFSISDSDTIGQEHFDAAGVKFDSKSLAYAQMAWADLNDPNGNIKYTFSHNTKIWALSKPDLSQNYGGGKGSFKRADVIFFDEAQDINPVMAKVIRDQNIQKVYVGDSNQAIYGFRGADDELDKVETDITLPMTRTFRFGQTLAGPGNRMLSLLKSKYKIIGAGKTDGTVVDAGSMNDADAVLTRSNAGRFGAIIEELNKGRTVGITKSDKADAESMIATVRYLTNGGRRPYNFHEDLDGYKTWTQVEIDVKRGKASAKVEMIYNLTNQYTPDQLSGIMARVVVLPEKGDAVDPSTLPDISLTDGSAGDFMPSIKYSVKDNGDGTQTLALNGFGTLKIKDDKLKPNGFRWDPNTKSWALTGSPEEVSAAANIVRGVDQADAPNVDVIVMTAHKSKGLEWKRVRIADDFAGPEPDDEGNLIFPDKQELNLAYVALTRGEDAIDPGSLAWIYDYTADDDEDPATPSRGLPEGVMQNGQIVEAPQAEEPAAPEAPAVEDVVPEDVTPEVDLGTAENPVSEPVAEETVVEEVTNDPTPEPIAPERKADAPLIRNEDNSNLDPAPAETTDTGVEGVSNDPQDIADTYDNQDLQDALVTAVQNEEPGINIEGTNGNTAIVPVENVRDALQKQGTNTNDLIDEALGAPEVQDVPAEIMSTEDSTPAVDQLKRFQLNHLLQTRDVPAEHKDAMDQIATDKDATDQQLDWAIDILANQPNLLDIPKADMPTLPDDVVHAHIYDPGQIIGAIESIYPGSSRLEATGDLIVHSSTYHDKNSKTNYKYELGVVRTSNELFYVYARETNLSTGETRSRRVSPFTHSARALNNDIIGARIEMLNRKNTTNWFGKPNSKSDSIFIQDEGSITLNDGTVEPIHRREEPVHRDLVEAIKSAVSNEDLSEQVIQGIVQHISRYGVSPESLRKLQANENISGATFTQIVDTLNAHVSVQYKVRTYGVYVSDDGETPVESGDLVVHTHEYTGVQRLGRIIFKQGTHWTKGYGYTDYVEFRPIIGTNADGSERLGKGSSVTSKNLTIKKTANGTSGAERRAALRDYVNVPVSKPATTPVERVAPTKPADVPETVEIDRTTPTQPSVEVDGASVPATANRELSISDYTPNDVDAAQLQAGDYISVFDPATGMPRLAEILTAERDDSGAFNTKALITNDDGTTGALISQSWMTNNDGLSGQRMIAYRKPVAAPESASDDSVQELLRSLRAHDTSFLDQETANAVADFTARFIGGEEFTQDEINNLTSKVAETPSRIATPTPAADAISAAQDVVDGDADSGNATALQDVVAEATIKEGELPESADPNAPNILTGYTILQNADGVYYPEGGIDRKSKLYKAIRRGKVIPPNFPFITQDTTWGGVMYFDSNGNRHWGQFGAAGAMLRVKDANGEYKYLLARRNPNMSTGAGKWSVPGGAHDTKADAGTPSVTAARELYEELGINSNGFTLAGDAKSQVAPDWAYDYAVIDAPDTTVTDGIDLTKNGEISELGWFSADEIKALLANDEMHGDIQSTVLDDIFNVGDAGADAPIIDSVVPDVEPDGFVDLTGFTQTGGQGGSNPGGFFTSPDGTQYYAKFQRDEMHAANEVAAAKLYNAAGVTSVDVNHGAHEDHANVTQSPVIPLDRNTSISRDPALRKKVQDGFAVDAWLANWDGVLNDNTLADANGDPVRMDVGGSLLYRAQGADKGSQFGDVVTEIDSLRDPRINSSAAAIYGSMTDAEIAESAKKLLNISDADIDAIVDDAFANVDAAHNVEIDNLKATLKARRQDILKRFGLTDGETPEPTQPEPTEAIPDTTPEVSTPEVDVTPEATPAAETPATTDGAAKAPEASYRPNEDAKMTRDFNAIMDNFAVINDSTDGDSIRVEYGVTDSNGVKKMHILGVRKVNGEWKASKEGEADRFLFDKDNGVYRLTNDELITKLDALGTGDPTVTKVLRFGSRANQDDTTLTPQMIEYSFSNADGYEFSTDIPTSFFSDSEQIKYNLYRDPNSNFDWVFKATDNNGDTKIVTIPEMQQRAASGEVFKTGTPRGEMRVGSAANDLWIDNPRTGDMMFSAHNSSAPMRESFTADENGNWISSYTGQPVSPAVLKQSNLYVGDPMVWLARSNYTDPASFVGFESGARGGVKTASKASKEVIESLSLGELFTDGTDTYRVVVGGARSMAFLNTKTQATVDRVTMRKNWDLNGKNFKFLTGLEGVNMGDTITEPAAAMNPLVGTTFKRDSEIKLPYFKNGEKISQYFTYDGTRWRNNAGEQVSKSTLQTLISKGDITLSSPDLAVQEVTPSGDTPSVDVPRGNTPATTGDVTRLDQKIQNASPTLAKHFPTSTIQKMSQEDIAAMEAYIAENTTADGKLPASAIGEAAIMFSPDLNTPLNKNALLTVMRQLDSTDHGSRGRTFRELLDKYETAKAARDYRQQNLHEVHPLGGLGHGSEPMMELVNSLFPELSDKPDVVATKQELQSYDSPSELIYRGVSSVGYVDDKGNSQQASGQELQKMFREADGLWWGHGVYGQGLYFAEDVNTSLNSYANRNPDNVGIFKIKDGSNILTSESTDDEEYTMVNDYAKQMITAYLISIGLVPGSAEFNAEYNKLQADIFGDAGPRAAFFGYDALYIANNKYYVLLNRGATVAYDGTYQDWKSS